MERPVRAKLNTQIYEEACEWFIECRAGDLDQGARAEFDRWLRKSPEHQSAYLEIAAIWNEGPALDPGNRWGADSLIAQADRPGNVIALERTSRPAGNVSQSAGIPVRTPPVTVGRRRLFAIAASIFLVTAATASYFLAPHGVYATTFGEQRSLALNDGSTVQLNSLSKIRIRYTENERAVDLLQGQALFHVAKDAARPFIVHSGPTGVRAVGTEFDVYRKATGTVVTVVEGRVAVLGAPEHPDSSAGFAREGAEGASDADPEHGTSVVDTIFLAAGEQLTVTPRITRKTQNPNVASTTAWTQRRLVFDAASLTEVADEFNRYNERKLVIDPSALGAHHISGVFSSTDPASLIRFLRDRPGLHVTENPAEIRVEKAL